MHARARHKRRRVRESASEEKRAPQHVYAFDAGAGAYDHVARRAREARLARSLERERFVDLLPPAVEDVEQIVADLAGDLVPFAVAVDDENSHDLVGRGRVLPLVVAVQCDRRRFKAAALRLPTRPSTGCSRRQ